MRRRDLIALLAAAVLAAPAVGRAQRAGPPVVGYLSSRSSEDSAHLVAAFLRGLAEGGFAQGKDVHIEYRWARGDYGRLPGLAAELARLPVDVLVATGGEPAAAAATAATHTIPIVFSMGSDPVKAGLVAHYNRPEGNVTGINIFTATLDGKRLEVLHALVPYAPTIGFLVDRKFSEAANQLATAQNAARTLGVRLELFQVGGDGDIDAAFDAMAKRRISAVCVAAGPFFDTRREKLVHLAALHAIAAIYHFRDYALAGGLASYGIDLPDAYRQVGAYAARILKGAKPAQLPVVQSSKFELVVNLKTAEKLGLALPRDFLARVDEVLE